MLTILTSEWWSDLNFREQILWGIALISTILFALQTILAFMGLEGVDEGDELNHGFKIFSLRSIIAFFTFLSWGGLLALHAGKSIYLSVLVGTGFGLSAMLFIAWMIFKTSTRTEAKIDDLNLTIGSIGEVYIPIPGEGKGKGKIQLLISQKLKEVDAITQGAKISTGEKVLVLDIKEGVLIVTKTDLYSKR